MIKIIFPLAGSSELFFNSGFTYPKPLIDVKGIPMIQFIFEKIIPINIPHKFIFIINEEDVIKYHLDSTLKLLTQNCDIIKLKNPTKGALCSILMAIDYIDNDDTLLILNGDQIIEEDFNKIIEFWEEKLADVGVVTFKSIHPRWSYVKIENDLITQTAEKNPISQHAIAGYYYFSKASLFFENAFRVIRNKVQLNDVYFISPVINEYILAEKKVYNYEIDNLKYHSFYSPQKLNEFENLKNGH
ncbi:glycosyltransferase family 2 protein [Pedobacter aquatilis]|uniref:glycosyltransferase family 2 protein n=1 Tax=Pedobacter aquatilis TaxID=351343 RepID=UPI00292FCD30|nr:glycosyltransferase family 2 protein [Pedobacter aquatilis]